MAEIVLFHSALGLRPGLLAAADRLRAAGHAVHTPDLFDGEVFIDYSAGMAKRDAVGIPELIRRGQAAVEPLPAGLVVAGWSMGTALAVVVATSRPGVRAAVLMHGALPAAAVEATWPRGVPAQVHATEADPFVEDEEVEALAQEVKHAGSSFEVFRYPGGGHLFADPDLPEYDPVAAETMWERVGAFLERVPGG